MGESCGDFSIRRFSYRIICIISICTINGSGCIYNGGIGGDIFNTSMGGVILGILGVAVLPTKDWCLGTAALRSLSPSVYTLSSSVGKRKKFTFLVVVVYQRGGGGGVDTQNFVCF